MKSKLIMTAGAGLVLCALACTVRADFLPGSYTYKLVLRDDQAERLQLPVDAEIRMVPDGSETRFEATTIHYPPLEPVRCRFDVPVFTRI